MHVQTMSPSRRGRHIVLVEKLVLVDLDHIW